MGGRERGEKVDGYEQFLLSMQTENFMTEMMGKLESVSIEDELREELVRGIIQRVVSKIWLSKSVSEVGFDEKCKSIIAEAVTQINRKMAGEKIKANWVDGLWGRFNLWLSLPKHLRANTIFV